jgi:cytochrome b involved in lipid metabolism
MYNATNTLTNTYVPMLLAKITTAHEKIELMNKNLIWSDVEKLPLWSMAEFEEEALKSQSLILIDGLAVDISVFKLEHPGRDLIFCTGDNDLESI